MDGQRRGQAVAGAPNRRPADLEREGITMSHIPDISAPEPPADREPGQLRRLASRLLPAAAVLLDAVGVGVHLAGHDGFAECVRAGATALRATALVLRDPGRPRS